MGAGDQYPYTDKYRAVIHPATGSLSSLSHPPETTTTLPPNPLAPEPRNRYPPRSEVSVSYLLPRVLVRWVPDAGLRTLRATALGPKWGTSVQQLGIDGHMVEYPLAFALAVQTQDGRYVLDVGLGKASVAEQGGGLHLVGDTDGVQTWRVDLQDVDGDGRDTDITVDSLTPKLSSLLDYARNERKALSDADLINKILAVQQVRRSKFDTHTKDAIAQRERSQASHPLFNEAAFSSVAETVITGGFFARTYARIYLWFVYRWIAIRLWWATRGAK